MRFSDLYAHSNGLATEVISLDDLARHIVMHHDHIGEVNFFPVELDSDVSLGHIKYERDRSSAYGAEFTVANIRYDNTLNRCWRRYVCCKELMHVFDTAAQRVDSREKFLKLMSEFATLPLSGDISPMLFSELQAEWMAVLVLCPARLREKYRAAWQAKELSDYDVALALKVPEAIINGLMSDYYDNALTNLLMTGNGDSDA